MIGGVVSCLGVDLGKDFPGKQESNPLGHFEDRDFLELNENILAAAGGSWDAPPGLNQIQAQKEVFSERIAKLIESRTSQHFQESWGWKDPRTSLTIELFSPFLADVRVLWCQRDSAEVADSLWKRNQFERDKSLGLIHLYQERIVAFLGSHPQVPVFKLPYREVIQNPRIWVDRIIKFLDLQPSRQQIEEAVAFVLPRERIQKEKEIWRWKYRLSLPYRALKKLWSIINP